MHAKIIGYVPTSAVREILVQPDSEGRRGKWIVKLLEYDLDIKPTKLIKGQGLAKLLAESNCQALGMNQVNAETEVEPDKAGLQIADEFTQSNWYKDIVYVLQNLQCPPDFDKAKGRALKLKASRYCINNNGLYWKDQGSILLRCVNPEQAKKIVDEIHRDDCGGHLFWKATTYKILRASFYWPTLFNDVFSKVRACEEC